MKGPYFRTRKIAEKILPLYFGSNGRDPLSPKSIAFELNISIHSVKYVLKKKKMFNVEQLYPTLPYFAQKEPS